MRQLQRAIAVTLFVLGVAASADALTVTHTFVGSDIDGRRAWARFTQTATGGNITVIIANISPNEINGALVGVNANEFILTGLIFNLSGQTVGAGRVSGNISNQVNSSGTVTGTPSFAYSCASPSLGPCVTAPPTSTAGTNIGGEWGYLFNSAGFAKTVTQENMISTDGYGALGWNSSVRFDTSQDLGGGAIPNDLDYGFTSFGDNTQTNTDHGNNTPLILDAATFILSVPAGFTLGAVTDVRFQYGQGGFLQPHVDGIETPLPSALLLVSSGLTAMSTLLEVRRRRKLKAALQD